MSVIIDFHVHMLHKEVFERCTNKTVFTGFGRYPAKTPRPGAQALIEKCFSPQLIKEDLKSRGIDYGVLTSSTVLQGTSWASAQEDLRMCQLCNDQAANWQSQYSDTFFSSCVLPLQDMSLAMNEFQRCIEDLKIQVVNVSSSYKGIYLGDPFFNVFWEICNSNKITVWVHPEGVEDPWFQKFAMWNSLGQSIEETKCMASLIYEGVMTKFPSIKVVMAHGGGYFPHYLGRLDRNTLNRPDTVKNTEGKTPSDFLKQFYYDTCVYDQKVLKALIERVGVNQLVMGSDYPIGESDPIAWLNSCGLNQSEVSAIAGGNAQKLLSI
jgi:aminocarboxymuconate-semialdehyde decarboxylase